MLCKIVDLITDIPASESLALRCQDYLYHGNDPVDFTIRSDLYRTNIYSTSTPSETVAYMESAYQFYKALVHFGGFFLHASTVVKDGKAYLFSADSGTGKSTHTRLWVSTFGGDTRVINDDKPALRKIDGIWYAYGTPWCGKDHININEKAPIAGLCFLKQAPHNKIRPLEPSDTLNRILKQTIYRFDSMQDLDVMLALLTDFLSTIPVYELENLPQPEAAILSYETMRV